MLANRQFDHRRVSEAIFLQNNFCHGDVLDPRTAGDFLAFQVTDGAGRAVQRHQKFIQYQLMVGRVGADNFEQPR
ncbi:hypothetical protein D3C80_1973760 [compost metagenome]